MLKRTDGGVYLAQQDTNPFAIAAGVVHHRRKSRRDLEGARQARGRSARSTRHRAARSDFRNTPQAPFETLTLHLWNGGPRIAVDAGALWHVRHQVHVHELLQGRADVDSEYSIPDHLRSGRHAVPGRDAAASQTGFQAESTNPQAGAYTPFKLDDHGPGRQRRAEDDLMTAAAGLGRGARVGAAVPRTTGVAKGTVPEAESLIGQSVALLRPRRNPGSPAGQGLPHRALQRRARSGCRSVTEATRRAVRPRQGRRALGHHRQRVHGRCDDQHRTQRRSSRVRTHAGS